MTSSAGILNFTLILNFLMLVAFPGYRVKGRVWFEPAQALRSKYFKAYGELSIFPKAYRPR
jgi:hypothetical protein